MTASSRPRNARRVLHVAHQVRPHIGGIETVVAAQTEGLMSLSWSVSVVCGADTLPPGLRVEHGVRTFRMRGWNGLEHRFGVPFPFFSPLDLLRMRREVRRVDVVHIHDVIYLSSWVAAIWCLLGRTPYVVTRHVGVVFHPSALVRLAQGLVLHTIGRLVLDRAAAVLAIDEPIAAGVRPMVSRPDRVVVLGNGVDTTAYSPAQTADRDRTRASLGLPSDRVLALFVGRPVPKKGFEVVAAAAGADYDIAFVGGETTGPDGPGLHFVGPVAAERMPEVYACADLMVVASVGECPLTVLESMSTGLPVLVNDDPALHSPWTTGTSGDAGGAGDPVRFVDMAGGDLPAALRALAHDPAERARLGASARAHVQDSYSWTVHVERLSGIYQTILRPGGQSVEDPSAVSGGEQNMNKVL